MRIAAIRILALTAVAVLAGAMLGTPAEASSGPTHGGAIASVGGRAASAAADCEVTPAAGQGTINIRSQPNTTSAIETTLDPGEFVESACYAQSGGSYTACGGGSSWVYVRLGFFWSGYVARKCVKLYEWAN